MANRLQTRFLLAVLSTVLACSVASGKAYAGDSDSVQPVQGLSVFDGKGRKVGNVLDFFGAQAIPTIALRTSGELVILYVMPSGFTGESGSPTISGGTNFESADCIGTAYINISVPVAKNGFVPPHVLNGTKLYAFDGPQKTVVLRSEESFNGTSYTCRTFNPEQDPMRPLRFLTDLSTQFQPPFTMR